MASRTAPALATGNGGPVIFVCFILFIFIFYHVYVFGLQNLCLFCLFFGTTYSLWIFLFVCLLTVGWFLVSSNDSNNIAVFQGHD